MTDFLAQSWTFVVQAEAQAWPYFEEIPFCAWPEADLEYNSNGNSERPSSQDWSYLDAKSRLYSATLQ